MRRYVSALKAGTASPYECLRFFESSYRYREDDRRDLMRRAVLTLVRHDPLLLITSPHGQHVEGLSAADVVACIAEWSLGDEHLAAFLEGHLWMAVAAGRNPDHDLVARALAALERAEPGFGDDLDFLGLLTGAMEILGHERYPAVFDLLLAQTPAEWHSHPLSRAMRAAAGRADWNRYDRLRERWTSMPKNSHICACATNYVANIDGLRALDRGDQDEAVRYLRRAVSVNGCPHLNSGASSVLLAQELLVRNLATHEVAEHVAALEQYCVTGGTADLRKQLAERAS